MVNPNSKNESDDICSICHTELELTLSRKELKTVLLRQQLEEMPEVEKFLEETQWVETAIPPVEISEMIEIEKTLLDKEKAEEKARKLEERSYNPTCLICNERYPNGTNYRSDGHAHCYGCGDPDSVGNEPESPAEFAIEEREDFEERAFG